LIVLLDVCVVVSDCLILELLFLGQGVCVQFVDSQYLDTTAIFNIIQFLATLAYITTHDLRSTVSSDSLRFLLLASPRTFVPFALIVKLPVSGYMIRSDPTTRATPACTGMRGIERSKG
jgi:hypothetical protein